jgi:nitrate reductase cytochrome c-type subunit
MGVKQKEGTMNKMIIGLVAAAVLAGVSGAANASPNKYSQHNNNHNDKPRTINIAHVQQNQHVRPARAVQPRLVQIAHKGRSHHHHYDHKNNCRECHGSSSDKLFGALVIGAVAGGVLYALAN